MKNKFDKVFTILLYGLLETGFQVQNSNTQTMDSSLSFKGVEEEAVLGLKELVVYFII